MTTDRRHEEAEWVSLRAARLNRGLTIRALAQDVGVTEQVIRRLEARKRVLPARALKVAEYFGVQVTDLMPYELDEHDLAETS